MPNPDIYGTFDGTTGLVGFTPPAFQQVDVGVTGINHDLSAPIVEQLNLVQQADLCSPLVDYAGSPVLLQGVDPTTGRARPLTSSDALVRTNGSPAFATGIHGLTGIQGTTGVALRGSTGALGATGIGGATGIAGISGYTGVLGARGAMGSTGGEGLPGITGIDGFPGLSPNSGFIIWGATGVQGGTGGVGQTGISLQGTTGLGGLAFNSGITGLQGFTGISSSQQGLTGLQGVAAATGVVGITGISANGASLPLRTLSSQTTPASSLQYTLPGNTLSINGNFLDILAFGSMVSGTRSQLQIIFGGTTLFSDASIYPEVTPAFYVKCKIFRNTPTEQLCLVEVTASNAYKQVVRTVTSHTLSNDLIFSISSTSVDALVIRLVN